MVQRTFHQVEPYPLRHQGRQRNLTPVIDYDGSGGPPDPEDIVSFYDPDHDGDPDPVVITSANRVTGIDFEITSSQQFLPMITK